VILTVLAKEAFLVGPLRKHRRPREVCYLSGFENG
jgi:hypothetical protein